MSIEAVKKFGIEWSRKIDKSKPGPPLTKHNYICWKGQSLGRPTARAWRSALSIGVAASRRGNGHWCQGRQRHRGPLDRAELCAHVARQACVTNRMHVASPHTLAHEEN